MFDNFDDVAVVAAESVLEIGSFGGPDLYEMVITTSD